MDESLRVTQEIMMAFWKGDKLVAVERKNGKLERYITEEANWGNSVDLFDAKTTN